MDGAVPAWAGGWGINAASPRGPRQRGRLVLLGAATPCAGAETQTPMWPPCKAPWPSLRGTLCSLLPRGDFHRVYLSLSAVRGCHHGSPPGHISRFTPQCPRGAGWRAGPGGLCYGPELACLRSPEVRPLLSLPGDSQLPLWVSTHRDRGTQEQQTQKQAFPGWAAAHRCVRLLCVLQ